MLRTRAGDDLSCMKVEKGHTFLVNTITRRLEMWRLPDVARAVWEATKWVGAVGMGRLKGS